VQTIYCPDHVHVTLIRTSLEAAYTNTVQLCNVLRYIHSNKEFNIMHTLTYSVSQNHPILWSFCTVAQYE